MVMDPDFISKQTIDSRRFYLNLNPPPNAPLTVVCGGVERMQDDYLVERSSFPYFGVELVAEGTGSLALGAAEYPLSRGTVFAYGPGIPHRIENCPPGRMRKYFLDLAGCEAERLLRDTGLLNETPINVGRVTELTVLWDSIDREARDSGLISHQICELISRTLILKLKQRQITSGQRTSKAYETYESVRAYIEANCLEVKTVEQVAEACDLTPIHISRLFKRFNSVGAYRFLIGLRMNHAADLLIHKKMLVGEVAKAMGFSGQFQFTRAFKREYGIPPTSLVGRE
jgi:AraC-like DNA-binding protein